MAEEEEFEDQLEQEKLAKVEEEEKESAHRGLTYTDDDGTVMEWDPSKKAYFPQIDTDFIARYQMNYGVGANEAGNDANSATATAAANGSNTAAPATTDNAQAWQDYYKYYYQQTGANPPTDQDAEHASQQNYSDADWYSYYYHYYGEDYARKWWNSRQEEKEEEEEEAKKMEGEKEDKEESDGKGNGKKKGKQKGAEKRKVPEQPPSWFEMDEEKSTHVYVSNLPSDLTEEEYKELMSKCGLIMFDPITRKPKLKLYRNADGTLKGDGLCCYIKQESVDLALNILDGSNVNGKIISVERAKFRLKGEFDPSKKKKKLSNKAKRKLKEKQEKLFDWRPDKAPDTRLRFERIVILKNMFDVKEFETDPSLINELREDVRSECSKFGDVRKVQVHDHHIEGVISVTFRSPEEADVCIAALNGRWFAAKRISAETYDGKTKYEVNETEAEKEERLRGWEKFLETDSGSKNSAAKGKSGEEGNSGGVQKDAGRTGDISVVDSSPVTGAAGASSAIAESEDLNTSGRQADLSAPSSSQDSQGGAAN